MAIEAGADDFTFLKLYCVWYEEILNHAKPLYQVLLVFNNSQFTIHCSLVRQMFCIDLLGRHAGAVTGPLNRTA
jgi:hypothetical protein